MGRVDGNARDVYQVRKAAFKLVAMVVCEGLKRFACQRGSIHMRD
jgi:hypothetical protein